MMNVEQLAKTLNAVDSDLSRMKDPLEPLKVASALKSELLKYEYRKEHNPKAISVLDYTIITALMRQTPMPAIACENIYPDGQFECPICGCAVTEVHRRKVHKLNRCCNCGQLIGWQLPDEDEQGGEEYDIS